MLCLEMDPPSLINDGSFPSANASSYTLTEIWPFSVGEPGGVLGLRRHHFGQNLAGFVDGTGSGSVNRDMSVDESTVTEQSGSRSGAGRKRRDAASEDESSKHVSTSSGNDMNDSDGKRQKHSGSGDENGDSKVDVEANSGSANKQAEQSKQPSERPKQDYIHVRARRGQATDSHSLAERARREKISERMKILQDLVPGCNKVIGKALVLDEIINYIQSLQRQVEFLSMKLEAVNSRIIPSVEGFPPKDLMVDITSSVGEPVKNKSINLRSSRSFISFAVPEVTEEFGIPTIQFGEQTFDTTGMAFNSQATREYGQGSAQDWLHMQVGSGFERAT